MDQGDARRKANEINDSSVGDVIAVADQFRRMPSGKIKRGGWADKTSEWGVFDFHTGKALAGVWDDNETGH